MEKELGCAQVKPRSRRNRDAALEARARRTKTREPRSCAQMRRRAHSSHAKEILAARLELAERP